MLSFFRFPLSPHIPGVPAAQIARAFALTSAPAAPPSHLCRRHAKRLDLLRSLPLAGAWRISMLPTKRAKLGDSAAVAGVGDRKGSNGNPNVAAPEIDEDLHSRQLAVYGRETMRRLFAADVLPCHSGQTSTPLLKAFASPRVPVRHLLTFPVNQSLMPGAHRATLINEIWRTPPPPPPWRPWLSSARFLWGGAPPRPPEAIHGTTLGSPSPQLAVTAALPAPPPVDVASLPRRFPGSPDHPVLCRQ